MSGSPSGQENRRVLRQSPQQRVLFKPEVHVTKHRSSSRIQAQQQQSQGTAAINGNGAYSTPVGAMWSKGNNAPNFRNYVPQQPQQFQQPFSPGPGMIGPMFNMGFQQPGQPQPYSTMLQPQQLQQHQLPPQPQFQSFTHQPQIQNVIANPIITPANNPQTFQSSQMTQAMQNGNDRRTGMPMLGSGVGGADLMTRILMALKSQIQSEEDWALAALIQVSYNSPNACNLRAQSTLANTVLKRIHTTCVEASKRNENDKESSSALDEPTLTGGTVKEQQKVLEALLVLRNTSFDPENAQFLAHSDLCRFIVIHGLNLPDLHIYSEFKHMCLEIVEAISFQVKFESLKDPLFTSVVDILLSSVDRSIIIPALRSLARFLIKAVHLAQSLNQELIVKILLYLLTDDEELITASLDFLYQYTLLRSNVPNLLSNPVGTVTKHLIRILTFGIAKPKPEYIRLPRLIPKPVPTGPPVIPENILKELYALAEPARATSWIRSSYTYDSTGEVTQISLWKAYESQFEAHARASQGRGARLLPAVDFIKNVTSAFQNAAAMVVNLEDGQKRFIIKGIVPRESAVTPSSLSTPSVDGDLTTSMVSASKGPPSFGVTVVLVLQNIARCPEGKMILKASLLDLMDATLLNPHIQIHIEELMNLIEATTDDIEDQDQEVQDEGNVNI